MASVKLYLNGTLVKEETLNPEQEYIFGRGAQAHFVLDADGISRQHFKLRHDGQSWICEVTSKFGRVQLNGHPIDNEPLTDGAKIYLHPYMIIFEEPVVQHADDATSPVQDDDSKAHVSRPNFSNAVESPSDKPEATGSYSDKTQTGFSSLKIVLFRLDESGKPFEEISLGDGVIEAGRSRKSDLQLKDPKAGRKHFTLTVERGQCIITDLDTTNKTYVNGEPIKTHVLKSGDEIAVGATDRFQFEILNSAFEGLPAPDPEPPPEIISPPQPQFSQPPAVIHQSGAAAIKVMPNGFEDQLGQPYKARKRPSGSPIARILLVGIVAFVAYAVIIQNDETQKPKGNGRDAASTGTEGRPSGPRSKWDTLSIEQQKFLDQTYNLALNLYTSGKYDLAALEINKILQIMPEYKDARNIQALCQQALEIKKQKDETDRRQREQEEMQARVKAMLDQCDRLFAAKRYKEIESCVSRIAEMDPENEHGKQLVRQSQNIMDEAQENRAARADSLRRQQNAHKTFEKAAQLLNQKKYREAIRQFASVSNMSFKDTAGLKEKSKIGIKAAKDRIMEQSQVLMREGRTAYEAKNYKVAIQKLEAALKISPENGDAKIFKDRAEGELHLDLKNMYGESVIEENLGNIESAKKKWRTILELGVPQDDYFKKAKSKLSKYEK